MEKKIFDEPAVEIIAFLVGDVIATSNNGGIELPDHEW